MHRRHLRRTVLLVPALLTTLLLGGCGEDPEPEPAPGPSGSASEPSGTGQTEPAVAPATGPVMETEHAVLHVPADWRLADSGIGFTGLAEPRELDVAGSRLRVATLPLAGSESFDRLVRLIGDGDPLGVAVEEAADSREVEIAGRPVFHLEGEGEFEHVDVYGLAVGGDLVVLQFALPAGGPAKAEREELIGSVLASVEWR